MSRLLTSWILIILLLLARVSDAGWTVVASTTAGSATGSNVTTSAIDTSTATLLVISVSGGTGAITPTDSKANHTTPGYSALTKRTGTNITNQLLYCIPTTVGSGHTFTLTGASQRCTISVLALKGNKLTSPFDVENGAGANLGTSIATGNVTPNQGGSILISGLTVLTGTAGSANNGFTTFITPANGANCVMGGIGYKIQTTATTEGVTWSWTGNTNNAATIAAFKVGDSIVVRRSLGESRIGSRGSL